MTDPIDLAAVVADYDTGIREATDRRNQLIRAARDAGKTPSEIEEETGYSRETVRLILLPLEEREKMRARRRKPKGRKATP